MIDTFSITNTIVHGDCLNILQQMPDGCIDAILTDPPYGVTRDDDDYIAISFLSEAFRVLKPNSAIMMCVGQASLREFWNEAERIGFRWLNTVVWHYKNTIKRERKRFAIQYDPILYFSKGDFIHNMDQVRVPYLHPERLKYPCNNKKKKGWMPNPDGAICGDVWEIPAITTTASNGNDAPVGHKWQKPTSLFARMIQATTKENDLILDPFCGSGTCCVAAKALNRNFIGIDVDISSVDKSNQRLLGEPNNRSTKAKKQRQEYKDD